MTRQSAKEIDPTDAEHRELGAGLLEEDMGPSSATAHLYRGEIHRMKFWRERLDRTTNWAVVVISAILTWGFSRLDTPHYILLIGIATLTVFLIIEARRYRGYDMWRSRVRKLQENVFAYGLDPSAGIPDPDWRENLGRDYREPTIKISMEEAIAHRLQRVYLPLFTVLLAAWLVRITVIAPGPWVTSAAVGMVPGEGVIAIVTLFYLGAGGIAVRPRTWHAKGELRSKNLRK
ncbi:DUF2270 domain-containing protein [Halocatena pleomorpha]|uniref:DUF2270 domain-containing protein n=1 Tax=Halocatena pleomorpha TaxID=1785090 RepID=A0A3P3RFC7_9EURY|nr:DUF2270 domain-containing protein [Halocatena pleomorpha]RRJ31470.1 DUF2270 domain-containing protein [Halocatena pleomorpha]